MSRVWSWKRTHFAATHGNTLQHTTTHCNTPHTLLDVLNELQKGSLCCNTLQYTAHCNTQNTLHTKTHCKTQQHAATGSGAGSTLTPRCNALQRTETLCNSLQHTATHCNNRVWSWKSAHFVPAKSSSRAAHEVDPSETNHVPQNIRLFPQFNEAK